MSTRSLSGKIITELEQRHSPAGKSCIEFVLEDKEGKRHDCSLWSSYCKQDGSGLEKGLSVLLRGFHGDKGDYVVKSFELPERRGSSLSKEDIEDIKIRAREMRAKGYVRVTVSNTRMWKPKEECIEVDGKWRDRMDFLLAAYGPKRLSEMYREFCLKHKVSLDQRKKGWIPHYKDFRDNLCKVALKDLEEVPF